MRTSDRMNTTGPDALPPEVLVPKGMQMQATDAEIRIRAKLGRDMAQPTIVTSVIAWALGVVVATEIVFLLDVGGDKMLDRLYWAGLGAIGLFLMLPAVIDRVLLRVNARGVSVGMRPVPLNGFPFYRHIPTGSIAAVYLAHCEQWVRFRVGTIRSFEVHVLTKTGESVCLLKRLPEEAAKDLISAIRRRLGPIPQKAVPLRNRRRPTMEQTTEMTGIPPWFLYLEVVLIGVSLIALPFVRVRDWQKYEGTVVKLGRTFHDGRNCQVRYAAPGGAKLAWVDNRCPGGVKTGETLTVYFNPQRPDDDPQRVKAVWWFGVPLTLVGCLGMYFVFDHTKYRGGRRILYRDDFKFVSRYWKIGAKYGKAAKGVLTMNPAANGRTYPFAGWAADPGAIELQMASSPGAGAKAAAGILFGATTEARGIVFGIEPHSQMAFARRIGSDWNVDLMRPEYVREIRAGNGEWNALHVEFAGGRADFFVNGGRAGSVEYESPIGGGMAGIYLEFDGGETQWNFSHFAMMV
jgi:hypothetical protein